MLSYKCALPPALAHNPLSLPAWWALPLGQGTESTQPAQQWGDTAWLLQSIILYAKLYIREESL